MTTLTEWSNRTRLSQHPFQTADHHYILPVNAPMWILLLKILTRTVSQKEGTRKLEENGSEVTTWAQPVGSQKLRTLLLCNEMHAWWLMMRKIADDALKIHFGLRLINRDKDHAYCYLLQVSIRSRNYNTWCVGQMIKATLLVLQYL